MHAWRDYLGIDMRRPWIGNLSKPREVTPSPAAHGGQSLLYPLTHGETLAPSVPIPASDVVRSRPRPRRAIVRVSLANKLAASTSLPATHRESDSTCSFAYVRDSDGNGRPAGIHGHSNAMPTTINSEQFVVLTTVQMNHIIPEKGLVDT